MAEARSLKQREYGTDVLSHPDHNVVDYNRSTRYNNTNRSNAFHNEPDHQANKRLADKRNNFLAEKPLQTKATRASYQDSNIFGNKNAEVGTVQASALSQKKETGMRNSNTFASQAFGGPVDNRANQRDQRTFQSGIFGDSITENKGRQRLGGASSGTQNLFGDAKADYQQSNRNDFIQAPKEVARPERACADASDAKARELYGNTASAYGHNKNKRDGALMSSGADWKNTGQQAVNKSSPMKGKNQEGALNTRDKKYQQLQSSVFGGGYADGAPVDYDRDAKRNAFGSNADWKTEAGRAKVINAGSTNVDTFRQRQKQLASSVLEQTDHQQYAPITKKAQDIDNVGHNSKVQAKGRKTDNEFKQGVRGQEKVRANYDGYTAKSQKQSNLGSAMDRPRPQTGAQRQQPAEEPQSFTIAGRESKAVKQAMLASNDPITGKSSLAAYNQVVPPSESRVIDLQLKNLNANVDSIGVKKMSGARHVISTALDEDNMKGICLGTGRIKIRLNRDENFEDIELNFAKAGVMVANHENHPGKKPAMTGPPKEFAKEIQNTKNRKQEFLSTTSGGGIFGQGGQYNVSQ